MANILTPEFRASFPYVFTPYEQKKEDGSIVKEYTVTAVFPKTANLDALKNAALAAMTEKWGADQTKWPDNLRKPFRKCKEKWKFVDGKQVIPVGFEDPDAVFMTFKSGEKFRPGIVDAMAQELIDPSQVYGGCYMRASVNAYTYDTKGNKGVNFGLQNLQKTRDGEPIGGRPKASSEFAPVEGASSGAAKSVFDD